MMSTKGPPEGEEHETPRIERPELGAFTGPGGEIRDVRGGQIEQMRHWGAVSITVAFSDELKRIPSKGAVIVTKGQKFLYLPGDDIARHYDLKLEDKSKFKLDPRAWRGGRGVVRILVHKVGEENSTFVECEFKTQKLSASIGNGDVEITLHDISGQISIVMAESFAGAIAIELIG